MLLQRGGGRVVHGIVEVDKLPGRSTAAMGGRAVVMVV